MTQILHLTKDRSADVVDVMMDAFYDYPVMRWAIGDVGADYDRRLRVMIDVFTASRFLRDYPVLGVADDSERLVAAAHVIPATRLPMPPELERRYEELFSVLGAEGEARLSAMSEVNARHEVEEPHYTLAMIGVRHGEQGKGYARQLMNAVHEMSLSDSSSHGVSLTTETAENVPLYEHFGYRVVEHEQLDGLQTWMMYRPDG